METFGLQDELFSMFGSGSIDPTMIKLEPQALEVDDDNYFNNNNDADDKYSCSSSNSRLQYKSQRDDEDDEQVCVFSLFSCCENEFAGTTCSIIKRKLKLYMYIPLTLHPIAGLKSLA